MEKIDFELRKKKDFFNYKRSTMFNSIFFIFILLTVLNFNLWFFITPKSSTNTLLLVASISLICSFTFFWSLKGLRLRLNKRGSYFVSIVGLVQLIYFIVWTLNSYS
jgi:Co/Zn/Cd efflux system component